jgi:oligopeptide transport system substrate-binding protein
MAFGPHPLARLFKEERMLKKLGFAALALIALGLAAGCAKAKAKSADFVYVYTTEPKTLNYLTDSRQTNMTHAVNFVDGLLEHDRFGILRPSLALSWTHNDDYSVWTFKLRKGVKWVTSEAETYAEVKAKDWVAALKYVLDNKGRLTYLVDGFIKNAGKYMKGEITDFAQVGVKAIDDYTLEYSLEQPTPYFDTMLTYQVYYPVNEEFLQSKAADFGKFEKDSILYCGAYTLANYTSKSVIEYDANPAYWDKANVKVQHVKRVYFDSKDPDSLFNNFDQGNYVTAPVYTDNEAVFTRAQEKYKANLFRDRQDGTTFAYAFNYDRGAYASPADPTKGKSPKSAKAKADTKLAVLNKNFRKAFFFGIDRPTILSHRNGEPNKLAALRNSYTCTDLASDKAGKDYVKYVEDALKALAPKDFGPEFKIDDGQDAYYGADKAKGYMAAARSELSAQGVKFPVEIDLATDISYTQGFKQDQSLKAMVEALFGADTVKVNILEMDQDNANASTYMAETGAQSNFDLGNATGWGPDYGDPYTFLQTMLPVEGAMLTYIGLDPVDEGTDKAAATAIGLDDYAKLVKEGNAEYKDIAKRYATFAKAEALLLDDAIILPYMSYGGNFRVTRIQPYSAMRSVYGIDEEKFKGMVVTDHVITVAERDKLRDQWTKDRDEAFKKLAKK